MALKAIANTNMTYQIVDGLPTPVTGTISIMGVASTKVKADGAFVYQDGLSIQVINITSGPATIPDPGPISGTISAMATKVKAEGSLVLRLDDATAILNATPQIPGSPPVNYPVTFKVKITNAGNTKVNAQ